MQDSAVWCSRAIAAAQGRAAHQQAGRRHAGSGAQLAAGWQAHSPTGPNGAAANPISTVTFTLFAPQPVNMGRLIYPNAREPIIRSAQQWAHSQGASLASRTAVPARQAASNAATGRERDLGAAARLGSPSPRPPADGSDAAWAAGRVTVAGRPRDEYRYSGN